MKKLLLITFVLFATTTKATNYYFSSVSGDDSRTSTEAKSSSTPWKTLSKLNSFFSSLQPGDSILFKRGETFNGSITINKSGTSGSPIVLGAYGSGNKPIITGLATLSGWVSTGNGIYESYNSTLGSEVNVVLMNNVAQQIGRYPNTDAANNGYLIFESHSGTTSITDNELTTATNWAGADVVIRTRRWVLDRGVIKSHSGGTLTYTATSSYEPYNKYGYFIQNSIKTLDKFGEWYYNPSTKKLSVYFGSNNPSSYTMQASTGEDLISSNSKSYVVFDNLNIKGSSSNGFDISGGSGFYIKNCDIMFSGRDGVNVGSHTNFKIENCTVSNSGNNGIELGTTGNYAVVRNNKITNTSVVAGMGQSGDTKGLGLHTCGSGNIIENNQIINTGYIGIDFTGDNVSIKNNYVDSFCIVKDDGAGIYSYIGSGVERSGRKITGNIVMNGMGADQGTDNLGYYPAEGIYMDKNASGVDITDNTIANCRNYGIYLHNAYKMNVKNNTFFNNVHQLAAIQKGGDASYIPIRNNVITNNIFFSKAITQLATYLKSDANDLSLFGKFDSNYYARPLDDRLVIYNSVVLSSGSASSHNMELSGWQDAYQKDVASKRSAKPIAPYKINSLIATNKFTNGNFTSSSSGVQVSSCSAAFSTTGSLDGGCLQVTPSAKSSTVYMNIGGLTAGKMYVLKYSLRGAVDSTQTIGAYLRKAVSPYTNLTPFQYRKVNITRSENEMIFVSPSTETSACVVFIADDATKYYLDNIQVNEADATVTNIDDSLKFVYNTTSVDKTISLSGSYVDVRNAKYSNSIVLKPFTSSVLTRTSAGVSNVAPTVSITSPANNASFNAPASVTINATAADADGSVSKVEFYNGTTLLGSDNSSPYSYTWTNMAAGSYTITAKATDNSAAVTASSAVTVSVITPNVAPTVTITSPTANASFNAPASVTINATAADADGSVSKVEFYNGTTLLGSDNSSPYSYTLTNVAAGSYTITAKATDNSAAVTASSAVTVSVITPNVAPTVTITSPTANASFNAPASVTINATAADADGSVSKVEFYNGTTLLGSDNSSPYSYTWTNVAAGSYAITAKATDNSAAVTASSAVTVSVVTPNVAPTVTITSPTTNASFNAPASVTINATAADADGSVSKVEFYNGNTLLGSDNSSPYSYTWTNVAAGSYTITAKATDNSSAVTASSAVTVSVVTPNVAPTVTITSPTTNASFNAPASVTINATAADADGSVSKVEFYNGNTLLGSDNSSPYSYTWTNVAAGSYAITAKATDNSAAVTASSAVTVSVITPNVAPTVTITSPTANASFNAPASVTINATAADADGSVSKVEFYNGNTLLGSDNSSPYSYTWTNVAAGSYTITAKATDNSSAVTASSAVTVSVITPNVAPTVTITSPVTNASFNAPASVTINATAADADGSVSKVEFYNGTVLLGSDNSSPYSYTWTNVAAGSYTITAKATDNSSAVTASSAVTVSVVTPNVAPTVTITSPTANASFNAPASVTINATAADADGSVSKVEFYNGTTLLGSDNSSPYSYTLTNMAAGSYTITAKATDNSAAVTASSAVTVSVITPNVAPTVTITSPANSASFNAPASVTINATAADADGSVSKVEFYNGTTLLGSDNSSPYSYTWTNVAAGSYTITAKATDNSAAVTASSAVTVSVITPNVAPTVTITSPTANASFNAPASVTINATAADADGSVSKVEFYNGTTLLGSDNSSPYSYTLTNVAAGSYTITAKATDNSAAVTASSAVTVSVITPNVAPTVTITSPTANASFNAPASVTINATAADADGSVSKVEFYNGTTLLGSDNSSPYSYTWTNVAAGSYAITAKAIDNSAAVTASSAVTVSVITPNAAPTVTITSPTTNASFNAPASVTINATAADADGSVSKVEFYNGNTLLGSDNSSPYSYTWTNVAAGSYAITAKATDNSAAVTASSAVTVSVITPNAAPTVTITSPVIYKTYKAGATITLAANASDNDGTISKVEFYNGAALITTQNKIPYSWSWKNAPAGNYTITAKATDNSGLSATSDSIFITVYENQAPAVSIISPTIGSTYTGPSTISMEAAASDLDGTISKVEFFNGKTLLKTEYKAPYTCTWTNVQTGTYTLVAKATDNMGLVTTSDSVLVAVANEVINTELIVTKAPTIVITSPAENTTIDAGSALSITTASDDSAGVITKVDFYNGDTLVGSDNTSPYSITLNNVAPGNYLLTAKATNNDSLVATSPAVAVFIAQANTAPLVSILNPVNNATFNTSSAINIDAAATDSDGLITKVDFYNGSNLIGSDSTSPYSISWNNVTAGNYTLSVKGYDNGGLSSEASTTITVAAPLNFAFTNFSEIGDSTKTELSWSTNNTGKTSYFKILKGKKKITLKEIGRVAYSSSVATSLDYKFTDSSASGINYYKIVQVDVYDSIVLSNIIQVNKSITNQIAFKPVENATPISVEQNNSNYTESLSIKVGPNPASNVLSVFVNGTQKNKDLKVFIMSLSGTVLKAIHTNGNNSVVQMDVASLNSGVYIIKVVSDKSILLKQFVKW